MFQQRTAVGANFVLAPVLFFAVHRVDDLGHIVALYPDDAWLTLGLGRLLPVAFAASGLFLMLRGTFPQRP